jgi:hypothetical protein
MRGERSQDIRREIEATREEVADTVAALAYKVDVKARLREAIEQRVEAARGRANRSLRSARVVLGDLRTTVTASAGTPAGMATGAFAVGALLGLVLPGGRGGSGEG